MTNLVNVLSGEQYQEVDDGALLKNTYLNDVNVNEYLLKNPDFFIRNRALLLKLKLPKYSKAINTDANEPVTINLLDKHREILEARVATVENKYKNLIAIGNSNQKLSDKIHRFLCNINRCASLADVVASLQSQSWTRLNVEVKTWLWHDDVDMNSTATLTNLPPASGEIVDFAESIMPLQIFRADAPRFLGSHDFVLALPLFTASKNKPSGLLSFMADSHKTSYFQNVEDEDFLLLSRFAETVARNLEGHLRRV